MNLQGRNTQPLTSILHSRRGGPPVDRKLYGRVRCAVVKGNTEASAPGGSRAIPRHSPLPSPVHAAFLLTPELHACSSICLEHGFPRRPLDRLPLLIIHVSLSMSSRKKDILDILIFKSASIILSPISVASIITFMKFDTGIM